MATLICTDAGERAVTVAHASRRTILSGGLQTLVAQGVVMVLSLVAQRVILSTLSKEENGELFLIRRTVELFALLLIDVGFNPGALREVSRDSSQQERVLSTIGVYRLVAWLFLVLVLIGYTFAVGQDPTAVVLWCCYLLLASRSALLRYLYEIPQRAKMQFGPPLLHMVLDSVFLTIGVYLFRESLRPSVVLAIFAVSVIPGMVLQVMSSGWATLQPRLFDRSVFTTHVRLAAPVWITIVLMIIHDRLDAVALSMFVGTKAVGIFGAAYQMLVPFTTTLPIAAGSVLMPVVARLSQTHPEQASSYVATVVRVLTALGLVIASVTTVFVPDGIALMTKNVYADDAMVFRVLLWSMLPIFVVTYAMDSMNAYGRQRYNVHIVSTLAASTIVAGLIFIPFWGALGASLTKLVSVIAAGIMAMFLLARVMGKSFPIIMMIRTGIATVLCVALAEVLPLAIHRYLAGPLVLVGSGTVVMVLGIARRSDIVLLVQARGRGGS